MSVDSALAATLVTVFGGGLVAIVLKLIDRRRTVPDEDAAADVVRQVASGKAATFGPEALIALAQTVTSQGARIGQLEGAAGSYLARITELEHWGMWSEAPVPRRPPAWDQDPRTAPN